MPVTLQCVPEGHIFTASLTFGESTDRAHCPECDREVATRKV